MLKLICCCFGILVALHKCSRSHSHPWGQDTIRAMRIIGTMPAISADTSFVISDSYDIFYYEDLVMYKFHYRFDSLFNGRMIMHESRPNFFVFHKDSVFGYSYYPRPDASTPEGRLSRDTEFDRNGFTPFKFDSAFNRKPDSLFVDNQKHLVKVFNPQSSEKYPEKFTYYLYYSKKLAGLTESFFSRSMDNEKGMKLFRIRIVAHGHYYDESKVTLPQREILYEMTEIPLENRDEVLGYFDRYKKTLLTN